MSAETCPKCGATAPMIDDGRVSDDPYCPSEGETYECPEHGPFGRPFSGGAYMFMHGEKPL